MTIKITDDFSLLKIAQSGQCFRVRSLDDGRFIFPSGNDCLLIKQLSDDRYDVSCSMAEWKEKWIGYFDLNRSYKAIRSRVCGRNKYFDESVEFGNGIRILRQDPWETLVSFIISQRKSIPAISKSVEFLADNFGKEIFRDEKTGLVINSFPSAAELSGARESDLKKAGLGYRLPFVQDAVNRVRQGHLKLNELNALDDEELVGALQRIYGVGKKVANCVALFAYARTTLAPVDVWIQKAIDECFDGMNPFPECGDCAGIMQQYVFFNQRNNRK